MIPFITACSAGDPGSIPGSLRSLGEGMATHSGVLTQRIAWTEEPEVGHSPWGHKESDITEVLTLSLYKLKKKKTQMKLKLLYVYVYVCNAPKNV